ncbi:MAG: DEAD/DEAH box helicase [Crocinitomicaceae bacterium]|jgi:ATP-dependent RNA helicase RhlE|nr:DEAD/DEAH box helicase [Crocinitomicaceae bacterium]
MTFNNLGLIQPIIEALEEKGYTQPTPIQEQAIPILLKRRDLLGCAQTGTGKTAAFAIPIIQLIEQNKDDQAGKRKVKALVVTPTRELAIQIGENFTAYCKHTRLRNTVIFGGVKQGAQTNALRGGVDILVATPGRLLDLIQQGYITLKHIEYFVLDEADQMLDMGFIHDIKKILAKLPKERQSLFFSATMPKNIVALSREILGNYDKVTIQPEQATAERVEQAICYVAKKDKPALLAHLIHDKNPESTLVFSRTKHGADKIVRKLSKANITAAAIHGNKSQNQRQRALGDFKKGKLNVLVATDIAARGIDVSQLELVINYDLPNVAETYVHRIGRTGRASASGESISFCDIDEKAYLKDIQKLIGQHIPVIEDHPYPDDGTQLPSKPGSNQRNNNNRNRNKNNRHRNRSRNR